jgi:hypothetical protein
MACAAVPLVRAAGLLLLAAAALDAAQLIRVARHAYARR